MEIYSDREKVLQASQRLSDYGDVFNYYSLSKQENEYRINKYAGYFAFIAQILVIGAYILNALNVFILDTTKMGPMIWLTMPLSLPVFLICSIYEVKAKWVKYLVISVMIIFVNLLYVFFCMHMVLFFTLPLLVSCLYFKPKISIYTVIVSSIAMLISHLLSVKYSIVFDDPIVVSLYSAIVYGFIPRFCQYALVSTIVIFLNKNTSVMMEKGYEFAKQADDLADEQRYYHYEIVKNLAKISENKSKETGDHIGRVYEYMKILTDSMGYTEDESHNIALAAMLHDIGKLAVEEKILSKPAKLTKKEFEKVKIHTSYGKELLSNTNNKVLDLAATIAYEHHERWDGKGYHGLKGKQINELSTLMSVVDVYDALTSRRCYKEPWPATQAYEEIISNSGSQFSPKAVELFKQNYNKFKVVYTELE